jgi:hypothetical protein
MRETLAGIRMVAGGDFRRFGFTFTIQLIPETPVMGRWDGYFGMDEVV